MYLKLTAYYALKLYENGGSDEKARNIIMNTISVMVSNFEFSEKDFEARRNWIIREDTDYVYQDRKTLLSFTVA